MKKVIYLGLLFLALTACASKEKDSGILTEKDVLTGCDNPYVVLPGNYIIDLAAGSEVILNPDIHNFALFCDATEARQTLQNDLETGRVRKENDWRVYRLEGNTAKIGRNCGNNQTCLNEPAKIIEWLDK